MPTYLRRFYITKLTEYKKKENDDIKKANQKVKSSAPAKPGINPRFK
jgi:hypothetical protein